MKMILSLLLLALISDSALACDLKKIKPSNPIHPSSLSYKFGSKRTSFKTEGRRVTVYFPTEDGKPTLNATTVVFGHGKAAPRFTYNRLFRHLNGKGIAVVYPQYESWVLDKKYHRMARDYMRLSYEAFKKFPDNLNIERTLFSGHSNGAFMALLAAGLEERYMAIKPRAVVGLATAGWRNQNLERVDPSVKVSLLVGDVDEVTPPSLSQKIYDRLEVERKQMIVIRSFEQGRRKVAADHGSPRTFGWWGPRVTVLHYHGYWKYLTAAALEVGNERSVATQFVYGAKSYETFCENYSHDILRNW